MSFEDVCDCLSVLLVLLQRETGAVARLSGCDCSRHLVVPVYVVCDEKIFPEPFSHNLATQKNVMMRLMPASHILVVIALV